MDEKTLMQIVKDIETNSQRSKSNTKRLDNQDELINLVYENGKHISILTEKMGVLVETVKDLQDTQIKIGNLHEMEKQIEEMHVVQSELVTRVHKEEGKEATKLMKNYTTLKWILITVIGSKAAEWVWEKFLNH